MGSCLKWVIILPIFNFFTALALFLTLLLLWITTGHPRYKPNEASVVYISDVGAIDKPLFIALGSVIGILFVATLTLDYCLRRKKKLRPMIQRKSEKPLAIASIIFAFISALGLILLTIFDAFNHSTLHWTFALIFFVGLAISGILNLWEIGLLHKDHPESQLLKWSHRLKLVFVVLAVMCLIAMIVLMVVCSSSSTKYSAQGQLSATCNIEDSLSAVFEWCIAFLFSFYLATLILDLWPYRQHRDINNDYIFNSNMYQVSSTV